jgi:hypothetical protein
MKKFLSIIMILIGINSFSQTMYAKVPDKEYVYDTINDDVYYIDRGYKKIFIGDMTTAGSELNLFVKVSLFASRAVVLFPRASALAICA